MAAARQESAKKFDRLEQGSPPQRQSISVHMALLGAGCVLALFSAQAMVETPAQQSPALSAPGREAYSTPATAGLPYPERPPHPLLVNKQYPLQPLSFVPPDLVDVVGIKLAAPAANDFDAMTASAAKEGVQIVAVSGYRSYAEQERLHAQYQATYGRGRAAELSAEAGHSEHQTGLAVDIADPSGACALMACFASTPAGSWAAANAWRFGFIVRYPAGAEAVTGYGYEPWHLRHVGGATAKDMYLAMEPTLEAYLAGERRTTAD